MSIVSLIAPTAGSSSAVGAVAAANPIAGGIVAGLSIAGTVKGLLTGHPQDPTRLNSNAAAYARALAGDRGALDYLKYRSGQFGTGTTTYRDNTQTGAAVTGWATQKTMDDALQKFQAASQALGLTVAGAALPYVPASPSSPGSLTPTGAQPSLLQAGLGNGPMMAVVSSVALYLLWKLLGGRR